MKQAHTHTHSNRNPNPGTPCEACGASTRLVGLERSLLTKSGEIGTYQCIECANVQVQSHARSDH